MRPGSVMPTGVERVFGHEEVIVTKTDRKGRIIYANNVFTRVSGYSESESLGQPHSLIRHPDMPRCVFKLLWDTIEDGHEIFAYIVNLAQDGASFWVFAHVTPSFGADGQIVGYHSNRRSPAKDAVREVQALYTRLLAEEKRHRRPADAIEASTGLLTEFLAEQGMSYDEFVWSLANRRAAA